MNIIPQKSEAPALEGVSSSSRQERQDKDISIFKGYSKVGNISALTRGIETNISLLSSLEQSLIWANTCRMTCIVTFNK